MISIIEEQDIDFLETFYNPIAMAECLFDDMDNLFLFTEEKFSHVRLGQFPLLSYEYLLDESSSLTEKENFKLRERAGEICCVGGRRFGKTLFVEIVDILESMLLLGGEWVGFSSIDEIHIRGVLEKVIQVVNYHPLYKAYEPRVTRRPNYRIVLKTGYTLESVNMNLQSKQSGAQFFQKHFTRLYLEECSFETDEIYQKRQDSISENGCVVRAAGMTNFTKHTPCGKIFYDISKRNIVCNLPQYINPKWDEKEKARAIKAHGGTHTASYKIFVGGEVIETGLSGFDMQRVRKCYDEERIIKHFEITKDNFNYFKNIIVVDKPPQTTNVFINGDIGESAPSEIIILFETPYQISEKTGIPLNKYKYEYNITLYGLTDKEQFKIFLFLLEKLGMAFVGLDCTEGTGRAIYRSLEEVIPKENLVWCCFNEKVPIDFEKDDKGNIIFKDGKPTYKEEYITDWSIQRLKDLLYDERVLLPIDYKFDLQFNSVIAMLSGNRTVWQCTAEEDHMLAAWRVFAISQWSNEFLNTKPAITKKFSKAGV